MSGLDIFALVVLIVLSLTGIIAWIVLARLPGKIAKARKHPQVDAINVAGWIGAIFGMVFWPLALVWAYTKVGDIGSSRPSKGGPQE